MLFLIALVIAASFSLICAPALRKKSLPFYIASAVLSATVVILAQYRIENELVQKYILALFSKGAVATAFWCVVMFTGALPQKSALRKRLMPSRGELSIFSALLTLSHIVTYAVIYIKRLLNPDFDPQTDFVVTCAVVILLLCIMIPLTIMSFKNVRSKMKPKIWKNLQRTAYIFFALIYVHVLVLYLPRAVRGTDGYLLTVTVYTAVWALYLVMRLRKYFTERRKSSTAAVNALSVLGVAVPVVAVFFIAGGVPEQDGIPVEAPVTYSETSTAETATLPETQTSTSQAATAETTTTTTTASEAVTTVEIAESVTEEATATAAATDTEPESQTAAETTAAQTTAATTTTTITTTTVATTTTVEETEPPTPRIYNEGTFTGKAYGYDGYIYVTITVENDMITSISSTCEEEDISYWLSCREKVISQIIDSQQTEVDAVSGATYSSNAIMKAVAAALENAKK